MTTRSAKRIRDGAGWRNLDGTMAMTRCCVCGKENYAIGVITGQCSWCGY